MIDLILVIIFCVQLFRMARERGVSPVPYVFNYIILFILMMCIMAEGLLYFYGANIFKTEQGMKIALLFEPLSISFEVLLFFVFKKRIEKIEFSDEDENEPRPTLPNQKKDLSYFR